jgi:hypothetical protein
MATPFVAGEFSDEIKPTATAKSLAAAKTASAGVALTRVESRVVDVSAKTVVPTVVRAGEEVKSPQLNTDKVSDLVGRLVPITRVKVPRVVSQSIPAGTRIPKGTPVDLVMVPVSDIDFSLFDTVHDDFKVKAVDSILPLLADPAVEAILKKERPEDLTEAERATLTTKLAPLGVQVDDAVAGKGLNLAFQSLQSAKAFR